MGTTTGNVLISYDINKSHTEVKTAMQELNYYDNFKFEGQAKVYELPNTTLWHKTKTTNQAIADLKGICSKLNVTLERL